MTLFAGLFVSQAYADVTKTVNGAGGADYLTLKAAFDDINAGTINTGVITLQITGSTTETNIATLSGNGVGSAVYSSVNIYPTLTGLSISGNLSSSLITLSGTNHVTIDGRVHDAITGSLTGTTRDLTITNTGGATLATASTIILTANANHNTIEYCTIKGSGTGAVTSGLGTIAFTTSSVTTGNGNNTISNNLITNADNAKRPTHSINSYGTAGSPNTGNIITNNEFANFACLSAATNAIYLSANSSAWIISGNSFYESTTYAPTAGFAIIAINVLGGSGYTVNNNFIGGSAAQCGGTTAWTKTSATANAFMGISLTMSTTAGDPASEVQGNTIKNFVWSNSAAAYWTGINIAAGSANIGTTAGNTIGASTGTGSITFNYSAVGGAAVNGIAIPSASGTVNMQNNTIGSITTTAPATLAASINGVNITGLETVIFSNNTINNLYANSTSTGAAQTIFGINNSPNNTVTIDHNTITTLINATTNATVGTRGSVFGIKSANGTLTITNNTIHNLTIACANTGAPSGAYNALAGIMLYGINGVRTVSGNTIYDLYDSYPVFAGFICGIGFFGSNPGSQLVDHNFIYNLGVTGTNTAAATVYGIIGALSADATTITTFSNNIITLGGSTATIFQGINEGASTAVGTNKFYFNTVYIGGSPTVGAFKSYCLYSCSNTNIRDFRNNIFVNARSNAGSASEKHYAAYFNYSTTDLLTLGNNDYYKSGTGGTLGNYAATDVYALPLTTLADAGSLSINPIFATAGGTTAVNYYTSATLPADPGTGITTDYLGYTRPSTPKMGALENTILSASATALTGLDYNLYYSTGPSAEQSFTISGSSLANNVTVTPPVDYEISLTSGSGFQATALTLTPVSGTLASTTIFVRLKAGLTVATYTEDISITSSGATLQTVTLNGIVTDIATALYDVSTNFTVSTVNGNLKVSGVKVGDLIEVYNGLGQKIRIINATDVDNNIDVNAKGVLVVKVGSKATKVIL